jgi:hypothetical protein
MAQARFDQGRLDPTKHISHLSVFLSMTPEQRADRDALADALLDRRSPSFHRWLTPETYRARFGAKPDDIARVVAWLQAAGLQVHETSPLGTRVTFSGDAGQIEAAFQTEMHRYLVGGELHYAMATAPAVPADLAGVVLGLHNTHDFFPRPIASGFASRRRAALAGGPTFVPSGPYMPGHDVFSPADWAKQYDVDKLYSPGIGGKALDGAGVTIAIPGCAEIAQSDVDAFRTLVGLQPTTVGMTLVPFTGPSAGGTGGFGMEAVMDVEWSGGIAKGATVHYVYTGADDLNMDDAVYYIIEHNVAPVMSESVAGCEAYYPPSEADILEMNGTAANIMGITYMAGSGDGAATGCMFENPAGLPGLWVSVPNVFPGVTSVGGTQFPSVSWDSHGNLLDAGVEQPWLESNDPYSTYDGYTIGVLGGGGGISALYPRPAYQANVPTCTPVGSLPAPSATPMRQVPDLSLPASEQTPGAVMECSFDMTSYDCNAQGGSPIELPADGTSLSGPSLAGVMAILVEAVGDRLGNINPRLYELASQPGTASAFRDIVSGSNLVACGPAGTDAGGPEGGVWPDAGCGPDGVYGYLAQAGYDCASGLGSIDAYNLVTAWMGALPTSTTVVPNPTSTTEGATVTLTATVNVHGTGSNPVTGNVTFAFESFTDAGQNDLSWELQTVAIADGTTTTGHATVQTAVPVGLVHAAGEKVNVVALYGGDAYHLASQSPGAPLTFAPVSLAIVPATASMQPGGYATFSAVGGTPPMLWSVVFDTSQACAGGSLFNCTAAYFGDPTQGELVVGTGNGYVEIEVVDSLGAAARADIIVGSPTTPAPWAPDAGVDAGGDSGPRDASVDSRARDSAPDAPAADAPRDGAIPDARARDAARDAPKDAAAPAHDAATLHDAASSEDSAARHPGAPKADAATEETSSGGGCATAVRPARGEGGVTGGLAGLVLAIAAAVGRRRRGARFDVSCRAGDSGSV